MVPFRVFDREKKTTWIVLNYHPANDGAGSYLVAREDDSARDGELQTLSAQELSKLRLVDFYDDQE